VDNNIDGEAIGDKFGYSVSLSSNGETVAISAPYNAGIGNSGRIRVYELNSNSGKWSQLGDDIDGEAENDLSGVSVSLSSDGLTVAVGATGNDANGNNSSGHVRVYRLNEDLKWIILDDDIDGEAYYDQSGTSVSLSSNGDTVAIGSEEIGEYPAGPGHVRVYRLNEDSKWIKLHDNIDGEASNDRFGSSVSLSSDGNTVAIGARYNSGKGGFRSGNVRVYRYEDLKWIPLGDDDDVLDGEAENYMFGNSVSLSSNGETVAVGASGTGNVSGLVWVYELDSISGKWSQLGDAIDGADEESDEYVSSVSLSSDGETVAVGAKETKKDKVYSDDVLLNSGRVRVYTLNESRLNWIILGDDIDGEGTSVSLSENGRTVAIGATGNYGDTYLGTPISGYVKVYKW